MDKIGIKYSRCDLCCNSYVSCMKMCALSSLQVQKQKCLLQMLLLADHHSFAGAVCFPRIAPVYVLGKIYSERLDLSEQLNIHQASIS